MSTPTPSANGNEAASSFRRVAIAAGTLIVVILTVVIALFLAAQDLPREEPTPVAVISPTPTASHTPVPVLDTLTPTPVPTDIPSATPTTPSVTTEPTTPPPPPATSTDTPVPPTITSTSTPLVIVVTPTPPPAPPPEATSGVCQPPPDWVTYEVQPGDTFNSLATRTNTSVFDLQQVNCLDSFTLQVGQIIYLPFTPPTPTVTHTPSPTQRPGPTLTRTPTPIRPQIDSVTPNRVDERTAENEVIITVLGKNFRSRESGFKVELKGPQSVVLKLGQARSDTSFEAIVPPDLPLGNYDLVVTNPNDRAGVKPSAYTIGPTADRPTDTPAPAPDIIRFTPTSGKISAEIELTVQGRNFRPNEPGFKVELQATDGGSKVELDLGDIRTDTSFEAIIRADTLQRGDYDLVVTNPDGRSDIASEEYRAIE